MLTHPALALLGYAPTAVNFLQTVSSPRPVTHAAGTAPTDVTNWTWRKDSPDHHFNILSTHPPVRKDTEGQVLKYNTRSGKMSCIQLQLHFILGVTMWKETLSPWDLQEPRKSGSQGQAIRAESILVLSSGSFLRMTLLQTYLCPCTAPPYTLPEHRLPYFCRWA